MMKQAIHVPIVLVSLVLGNVCAWAESGNPFGFETKTDPNTYPFCEQIHPGSPEKQGFYHHAIYQSFRGVIYHCDSAPRPHPEFKQYALFTTVTGGLCEIKAESFMQERVEKVEQFKDQLTRKYGPPTSISPEYQKMKKVVPLFSGGGPTYEWTAPLIKPKPGEPIGQIKRDLLGNGNIISILFFIRPGHFMDYDFDAKRNFQTEKKGFWADVWFWFSPTCDEVLAAEAEQAF